MKEQPSRAKNLGYATVAAQSGCLNIFIIVGALILGLTLDAAFGVKGPFTVSLLLLSVPLALFVMVKLALGAVKQIQPPPNKPQRPQNKKEEG
jgi:hypothetical protein